MNAATYGGGCIPYEWIEAAIDDMFLAYTDIREVLGLEKNAEFIVHDLRDSYWSRINNDQLACFLKDRQSFWPISLLTDLGLITLILFEGPTSRVFVLSDSHEIPIEEFKKLNHDIN